MNHVVRCPSCASGLANTPAIAGRIVACPRCQTQFQMPQLATPPQGTVPMAIPLGTHPGMPPGSPGQAAPMAQAYPVAPSPYAMPNAYQQPAAYPQPNAYPQPAAGFGMPAVSTQPAQRPVDPENTIAGKYQQKSSKSPLVIIAGSLLAVMVVVSIVVGLLLNAASKAREKTLVNMHGNWIISESQSEIEPSSFKRFEFALHPDGRVQMMIDAGTGEQLMNGKWHVHTWRGEAAYIHMEWTAGNPDRWAFTYLKTGQLQVHIPQTGNVLFRPKTLNDIEEAPSKPRPRSRLS